jgi:cobalt-zinc-cadmium efflux system protein
MHEHTHVEGSPRRLRRAFTAILALLLIEAVGGMAAGSLALLTDATHLMTDVGALGLAWWAAEQAQRPATARRTYGFRRLGVLVALLNGVVLGVLVVVLAVAAVMRIRSPHPVATGLMAAVAGLALVVNALVARSLKPHAADLNVRAAWLHVLGDAAGSGGVLLAALLIVLTGQTWLDPLAGLLISAVVAWSAWRVVRDALGILLEGVPRGADADAVITALGAVPGVDGVHDVHLWALDHDHLALSAHLVVANQPLDQASRLRVAAADRVARQFGIHHVTLELECEGCDVEGPYCEPDVKRVTVLRAHPGKRGGSEAAG